MLAKQAESEQYIEKLFCINQEMIVSPSNVSTKSYLKEQDIILQNLSKLKHGSFVDNKTLSLKAQNLYDILQPKMDLNLAKWDVNQLAYEVMKIQSKLAEDKKLKVHYHPLTHLEKFVLVDGKKVQQICYILLENAIKYSSAGLTIDITAKITRKTRDGNTSKHLEISIKDEGQGMTKREYKRAKKIIKK